jgi:methionyl aminopeptidase
MAFAPKSADEIAALRRAGQLVAHTFRTIQPLIRPGVSLLDLDAAAEAFIREQGADPAYVGYRGFPKTICVAVNEGICHGIPSRKRLSSGDIVGIDIGVRLEGVYGDACVTYPVGEVSPKAKRLLKVAWNSLLVGLAAVKPGGHIGDIGAAIQGLAEPAGYGVVAEYLGHGLGRQLHEEGADVPHVGRAGSGPRMVPGMVFTVEPMINAGRPETQLLKDGWTVVTRDRSLSAQFEHTVLVTENGHELLSAGTVHPGELGIDLPQAA